MLHRIVASASVGLALMAQATFQHQVQEPAPIQKPRGTWQTPGEIQQPKGPWQKPGEIQVPKGIQAIHSQDEACSKRFVVGSDALFRFDESSLTPDAEETLKALLPLVAKAGKHPVSVEGHTDAKGSDSYNQALSERRAATVKEWLVAHGAVPPSTTAKGWGRRRPIAPNTKPDGSDDPAGRQRNRRVEIAVDLCAGRP